MSSLSIVKDFDVAEQAGLGLLASQIVFPMHLLFFERGKEAFDNSIIPAVAPAAHATDDSGGLKPLLIIMGRLLAAPVTMKKQLMGHLC